MTSEKKITFCKVFFGIGVFIIISALSSYFNVRYIIKSQIEQNIVLTNNSKAYTFWTKPPARIIRKYYFFHVKNPKEVAYGKKPNLVQQGPYVYSRLIYSTFFIFELNAILKFIQYVFRRSVGKKEYCFQRKRYSFI